MSEKSEYQRKIENITLDEFIVGDFDDDKICNLDDPHPFKPGDSRQVEQTSLCEDIRGIELSQKDNEKQVTDFYNQIKTSVSFPTRIRMKSMRSIVHKLYTNRLDTLSDLGGLKIVVPTQKDVISTKKLITQEFYNYILNVDDFYEKENPADPGYKAVHFDIKYNNVPIELQIHTKRLDKIYHVYHPLYKGEQTQYAKERLLKLVKLATCADLGSVDCIEKFDKLNITIDMFKEKKQNK